MYAVLVGPAAPLSKSRNQGIKAMTLELKIIHPSIAVRGMSNI